MSSFVAADESSTWECYGPHEMVVFFLDAKFLRLLATEVHGIDGDGVCYRDAAFHADEFGATLGRMLEYRLRSVDPISALEIDALALLLGTHVLRQYSSIERAAVRLAPRLTAKQLDSVIDYVHANLNLPLRLADIAASIGMSPYYFARAFRASTGTSPHKYVTKIRIERAQQLLGNGAMPLSHIAGTVGFVDQSHLTTTFRAMVGTTPAQYRKAHQG